MEDKYHYHGTDAVRHVIDSRGTMLVSVPKEIAIRAGLAKGVDVRVDQDPEKPGVIIVGVVNPADRSTELEELLKKEAEKSAKAKAAAEKAEKAKAAKKETKTEKSTKTSKTAKQSAKAKGPPEGAPVVTDPPEFWKTEPEEAGKPKEEAPA